MTEKIRWGILSTGRIAHSFAQDFQYVANGELIAVASRSVASAASFGKQYNIPKTYANYQALFDDPEIDAVYIATPHSLHYQNTIDAFAGGKAVLCEKPFTINAAECRDLISRATSENRYVMEAMWTFFLPAIQKARTWVAEGRIGVLKHIKADFGYPQLPYDAERREYKKELAGGCLLEMGVYPVALTWLFMQEDPTKIEVIARKAPNGVEDDLSILFEYSGVTATLGTSFRCKLQNWAYIIGEEGYIAIPDFWRASACYLYELDTKIDVFEDQRSSLGFNFETAAMNADLLAGRQESEIVPLSDSLKFQEHMEWIREKCA